MLVTKLLLITAAGVAAHALALGARAASRRLLRARVTNQAKLLTLTGFATSIAVFLVYFLALGYALRELGISLTAYLASASIIGLAVSFGSQGLVQDVITGLTVVFSDLVDVGDLVEVGGQLGIVEDVGIRFTTLVNFTGARVYVPNRTIGNVVNYPHGYVRAFLDVRLPGDPERAAEAETRVARLARAAFEQLPGILLTSPSVEGRYRTSAGFEYLRVKFRVWPAQGGVVETYVKPAAAAALREIESGYPDWMVLVHYRAEPAGHDPDRRLPRPSALHRRDRAPRR